MAADFCEEHAASVAIKQLWLFDNRLGDEGAAAVARILRAHPAMLEVHLSHNMLTCKGAAALLEALPVPGDALPGGTPGAAAEPGQAAAGEQEAAAAAAQPASLAAPPPAKPVWLRLEWNRISLTGLMEVGPGLPLEWVLTLGRRCLPRGCNNNLLVLLPAGIAPAFQATPPPISPCRLWRSSTPGAACW